jgi:hypothetical protein
VNTKDKSEEDMEMKLEVRIYKNKIIPDTYKHGYDLKQVL